MILFIIGKITSFLNYENNNFIGNLTSINQNILIANSKYNNNNIEQISFTVFLESDTIIGDTNTDGSVDILDVILIKSNS